MKQGGHGTFSARRHGIRGECAKTQGARAHTRMFRTDTKSERGHKIASQASAKCDYERRIGGRDGTSSKPIGLLQMFCQCAKGWLVGSFGSVLE